jgi:hypothetical protein
MSIKRPALPMTGGCPCGAIRYEMASFPLLLYTCNCTDFVPVAHIFMRSAQRWVVPAANAECHNTGPDDFRPLAERWRAMWPEFFPK